ncbi:LEAF RUST 10 DISEASE-RESISTANCE LOCUS RECEPTOR-LIKE PROTEIN KINASE-like 1.5 [Vigna unguiculata]|uniref:LEAF RUST 10 DISEASE-RESISTANCE LOCUS RECEPTOR-LIKE PROTEIN KINASE-like 1.5 n=1 Tax=Vigna unguiculata TaxID=3917 RepID=UPI0010171672|nr:LEAF RUST 10 DISEASE-RESISTANCE LOCUS RECEPTOR-LIKE PROTEIN KINASE-like 1.5 [Vigna unguiculata]
MSSSIVIIFLFLSLFRPCNTQTCSSNNTNPCPPFSSHPPFPFSSTPGCGHPSFHITCSSPHSFISINNLSFSILSYNSNTSSITLSPRPNPTPHPNCPSFSFIPTRPINLSATPFRVSAATCSRLSFLRPCSPPSLPNCSHCPSQCHLIKSPSHLLPDCRSTHHSPQYSDSPCLTDILGFLQQFLKNGIQLDWDQSRDPYFTNCTICRANNSTCGFNSSSQNKPFLCFGYRSQSTLAPPWIRKFKPNKMALFSTVIAITSLLLLISVATAILRSARSKASSAATQQDPTTLFLRLHRSASLLPPVFSYDDLAAATHNFDPKRKIGDGGFGSVYLAQLRDGRLAAVKYLHRHHSSAAFSTKSFCNEILILSSIHHANLVKLHGYCSDPRGLLLVYDYIPNGTLAEHLHHRKGSLTWQVRLDIALQTALAMEYLHFSVVPPVVHRDITSSNIFVERDMRIKVGDFGLSRLLVVQDTTSSSNGFVWTGPQGTPGYLDPDYHRSFRLTEKSDVYSFGVVLLELISGMKAVDQSRDKREMALADLVVSRIQMGQLHQVLDPVFKRGDSDGVSAVAELAFRCVAADKDDRPDSREVVEELRRVRSRTVAAKE